MGHRGKSRKIKADESVAENPDGFQVVPGAHLDAKGALEVDVHLRDVSFGAIRLRLPGKLQERGKSAVALRIDAGVERARSHVELEPGQRGRPRESGNAIESVEPIDGAHVRSDSRRGNGLVGENREIRRRREHVDGASEHRQERSQEEEEEEEGSVKAQRRPNCRQLGKHRRRNDREKSTERNGDMTRCICRIARIATSEIVF